MSNLYIRITRPEGYEDVHPDLILQDMGVDPVWGAEAVDVEAVLRECREALDACEWVSSGSCWFVDADKVENAIAKIDEVLK